MKNIIENIKFKSEILYSDSVNIINDTVDNTSAIINKTYINIIGTYEKIKFLGISVAIVTAPVPTIIGLATLWLMTYSINKSKESIDNDLKDQKNNRKLKQTLEMLKKYGKIPNEAIVETKYIRMKINTKLDEVNGEILSGKFANKDICSIPTKKLLKISGNFDEDSQKLIDYYISFRNKKEEI